MKITPEISALVEKIDIFWIFSGVNKVTVVGTGRGDLQERVCFSTFSHIFVYLPYFTIFSFVEQMKNLSFRLK